MITYKITENELAFLLKSTPAFGALTSEDRGLFISIMGKVAARGKLVQLFYFPRDKNSHAMVPVIKLIRTHTGSGLKEAKDMWDMETKFNLTDWKLSKEQLITSAGTMHFNANIHIEFI